MGLATVYSRACAGVEAPQIKVEVHLAGGLPRTQIVGMPKKAVTEARDRVRAALANAGFQYPVSCVTISLAPAELPKDGGCFDLPIAIGILAASGQVPQRRLQGTEFLGELSLGGDLQPVKGALPAALQARAANRCLVLPAGNGTEVALLREGKFLLAATLGEVAAWLNGSGGLGSAEPLDAERPRPSPAMPDMSDIIGQPLARRAMEIAAAGGHNVLLSGPPGTGKTLLASRLPGILPSMSEAESLETAAIASVCGKMLRRESWGQRPFRAPHHTASAIALVGGGSSPRPGEISLAHNGVLFLDELPEFSRHVLEVLREPMESGRILISRATQQAEFPARFQLVCAMNPCPCGMAGDPSGQCGCSAEQIQRYRNRISGPLLDRIDLQIPVLRPTEGYLTGEEERGESTAVVRHRVEQARVIQQQRAGRANARLSIEGIRQHCALTPESQHCLQQAAKQFLLSHRACHRIIKVARTIADLAQCAEINLTHLAEAIALRRPAANGEQ